MGDRSDRDRIMELELGIKVLESRLDGMQSLMGLVASRITDEDRKRETNRVKMAKARAGRGKKLSDKRG